MLTSQFHAVSCPLAVVVLLLGLLAGPLPGALVISEFMSSQTAGLADEDGDFPDWIELHNTGPTPIDLDNWFLTDDPTQPGKWRFASTNLGPDAFLVVFASGKDRRIAGAPFHTNFKLSSAGDYLGLIGPDGRTVEHQFTPAYPPQTEEVSYGLDTGLRPVILLSTNSVARYLIPNGPELGSNWIQRTYGDSTWRTATGGVGYSLSPLDRIPTPGLFEKLAGLWKFDELAGTNFTDSSGLGNHGRLLGFPVSISAWTNGWADGAVRFRGTSYRAVGRVGDYPKATSGLTLSAWALVDNRTTWATIAKNGTGGAGQFQFGLHESSGVLAASILTSSGLIRVQEDAAIPTGRWHHVAFTADGQILRLFRNGRLVGSTAYTGRLLTNAPPALGIGAQLNAAGTTTDSSTSGQWNGRLDDLALWNRGLTESEILDIYYSGVGYRDFVRTDVKASVLGKASSVFLRFPFEVADPGGLVNWQLRVRYDDAVAIWLNGAPIVQRNLPDPLSWDSIAVEPSSLEHSRVGETLSLNAYVQSLVKGTNVLAVHLLNRAREDHDLLCELELSAASTTLTTNQPAYFLSPTPGAPNRYGSATLGPIIRDVTHLPAAPRDAEDLIVTARVTPVFAPVRDVQIRYRTMFSNEVVAAMFDDGLHGDGPAGDRTYGAIIPATAAGPGQMLRYAIFAVDTRAQTNRLPLFKDPLHTEEYFGTVVVNPAIASALPVMHWFVKTPAAADQDPGTQCSLFYAGEFYDNAYVRLRGGTSRGWPKPSHKVELPEDHRFRIRPEVGRVTEFDWNTTFTDKSYSRAILVAEHQRDAGMPSPDTFAVRLELNGRFYSVTLFTEQVDRDFLERYGLDPAGSLYKGGPGANAENDTGFEKKTRKDESNADLRALLAGLALSGKALEDFVFDAVDLPAQVNYMATVAVTQNIDGSDKNYFLYRDTEGNGEWRMLPWDLDLSFGPNNLNTDVMVYNEDYTSHPFIGARPYLLQGGKYNRILEAVVANPRSRQMLLRRIRTLVDRFLVSPYFQSRLDQLGVALGPDVRLDVAKWGANAFFPGATYTLAQAQARIKNEYLAGRPGYLMSSVIPGVGTANPGAQPYAPALRFGGLEINPASGNQNEEYVQIMNPLDLPVDVSGWSLAGGVSFTFKPGTVIPSNSTLYVSPKVSAFRSRTSGVSGRQGLFVQGDYSGHLSARGGQLRLHNDFGREIARTNYPGQPSLAQQFLRVTEIMYRPPSHVSDAFKADEYEYLELANIGVDVPLELTGVAFTKGVHFRFTETGVSRLEPGERIVVVKNLAAFRARYGAAPKVAGVYLGSLENGREGLRLEDANQEEILEFRFNDAWWPMTDGLGFSLTLADEHTPWDGFGRREAWSVSARWLGTPAASEPTRPPIPQVLINEAQSAPLAGSGDAVELFNPSAQPVSIGGWYLSDDFRSPRKYQFPPATAIAAQGFLVVTDSAFGSGAGGFRLDAEGDEIWLFSADEQGQLTGYAHGFRFGAIRPGSTWGRHTGFDGREFLVPGQAQTLGRPNAQPLLSPLEFTEVAYHPPAVDETLPGELEFIELFNPTDATVSFSGPPAAVGKWRVSGGVQFEFPSQGSVAAKGFVILVGFDPQTNPLAVQRFRAFYELPTSVPLLGPWQGRLNNAGEILRLLEPGPPSGTNAVWYAVNELSIEPGLHPVADGDGASLHRRSLNLPTADPAAWVAATPSPGRAHAVGNAPTLQQNPQPQRVIAFQTARFEALVLGPDPLHYQWRWNGLAIPGATSSSLSLSNVHPARFGTYELSVYNAFGSVRTEPASLSVDLAPFITQWAVNRAVPLGGTNSFTVSAVGTGLLRYQWLHDGQEIPNATSNVLVWREVKRTDAGRYEVRIQDEVGFTLSPPVFLTVMVAPSLIQHPDDTTVLVGEPIRLLAVADGTPPLSYRWRKGTANLAGQTNALLQLNNAAPTQVGNYNVIIGNSAGSVTSRVAVVNVLADADRDGMADAWEGSNGFDPARAADAAQDSDGDGWSNRDEYVAGTNPRDPGDFLRWDPPQLLLLDGLPAAVFSFLAVSNHTYAVLSKTAAAESEWRPFASFGPQNQSGRIFLTNPPSRPPEGGYFRLQTPRVP